MWRGFTISLLLDAVGYCFSLIYFEGAGYNNNKNQIIVTMMMMMMMMLLLFITIRSNKKITTDKNGIITVTSGFLHSKFLG